jgi:hypothetical protein
MVSKQKKELIKAYFTYLAILAIGTLAITCSFILLGIGSLSNLLNVVGLIPLLAMVFGYPIVLLILDEKGEKRCEGSDLK